jgi:hypothetical protein
MSDNVITLTSFQYALPVPGELMKLYIFNKDGMHNGCIYFRKTPKRKYGEVDIAEASVLVLRAVGEGKEVRVTNGGDLLLFHMKTNEHGQLCMAYPPDKGIMTFFGGLL